MAQTTSTGSFYDARLEKEQQLHVRMLLGSDRALNQSSLRRLAMLDNVVLYKLVQLIIFLDFFLNLGTTAISSQYTFYDVGDYTRLLSTACIGVCALELFVRVVFLKRLMWSSSSARWDMLAYVLMAALLGCRYWKKDNRNNWLISLNGKEKDQFHDKFKINQIELYFAAAYCFAAALRFVLKSQAHEDSLKLQSPAKETTVSIASLRSTLRSIPGMTQEAITVMDTDLSILCGDSDGMITTGELQAFLEKAVAFRPATMSIAEFLQHLHCLNTTPVSAYGIQEVLGSTYRHWSNQKMLLTATFFIVLTHATIVPIMAYLLQILGDYAFPTSAMTLLKTGLGKKPYLEHQIIYPNKVLANNGSYVDVPIDPHASLLTGLIGLAAICIPYAVLDSLMGFCQSRLLSQATERMQSRLLTILLHEKTSFYAQRSEGDLNNLFASDIARVNTLWQAVFWNFIYPVVSIVLGFSALMFFDPTVGMMSFGFALISIMSGPRTFASTQSQTFGSKSAYAAAEFQNAVGCHKVIRAYRIQSPLLSKFTTTIDSLRDAQFKNDFWSGMVQIYVESSMFLFVAIMTSGMAVKVWGGYMTAGDFFSVVTLLSRISTPVTVLGGFMRVAIGNAASLQRLDTILDQRYVRDSDTDDLPNLPLMTSSLRFHKVYFQYPTSDTPVVMDFNATIPKGHYVCIVGPSGCGKSSLLNALLQVYPLAQGSILWDNSPLNNFSQASFLERVAVVFQDGGILNGTILDNIRYGCPTATLDDCKEAAQLANCHTFISQLPMQYDTVVGQHADLALSGGQMQRICLARALVRKPQVLLLDEATSALDTETEGKVVETLRKLTKKWGMTIISVTHRLATTQSADNIFVLHNGSLVEEGTYANLMAQPFGVFHEMVQKKLESNSPRSSVPKSDEEVMLLSEAALGAFTRGLESRVSSRRSSQRPSMDSLSSMRKNTSVLEVKEEEGRDSYIVIKAVMSVEMSLNATENVVENEIQVEMSEIPRAVRSSHILGHELSSAALSSVQSGVSKIQSIFRDKQVQQQQQTAKAIIENEEVQKLRLQAIWQLFVTGFEVIKYPKSGRARKRVIWLTLDGKLCVGRSKTEKHAGKFMLLWDIEKVEKGCMAPQFTNSLSWREARGKEQMCLSIAARSKNALETLRLFAIQVATNNVRNIIADNWNVLLNLLHGDADGVFPKAVRVRLARHFAATGEIMALADVRNALNNEGTDRADSPVKDGEQNSDDSASDEE